MEEYMTQEEYMVQRAELLKRIAELENRNAILVRQVDEYSADKKTDAQRDYKDRLFKFIFGNPENKAWTLSLYNAINGTGYSNPEDIQFNTISDAVYMRMKNDVSFIVAHEMNLWEHQSSYNPTGAFYQGD